ncbi:MAG TPA: carboxypeptidase-like regulatory domain-containing protein [Bryobacteraceae bacterium]|nr:carboxypeptidase-like regulatory domain-containing protein [Bryobacteraceae bacterium]
MRFATYCLVGLALVGAAFAQVSGTGSIQGTVSDPSGAVVTGASVTATNVATGVQTTRQTTDAGFYVISPLPAGPYTVTVKATGFQSVNQQGVILDALATLGLNFKLELGSATQSITVEAAPPMLKTDDATMGSSVRNEVYDALPLAMNGVARDPTQFTSLVPGVNSYTTQVAGPSFGSFNGGQTYHNEIYVEGLPMTSAGTQGDTRTLSLGISVEAVEQFQVETNGSKAMYEGQGVENYVLKSGTNQFHGGVYEYFRNTDLDARGFFPPARPIEHQNEFGGSVGGPIKKNKIFFFGNYDGYRFDSASIPALQSIPTLKERTGDFSEFPGLIYDPRTTTTSASGVSTRDPFPGNMIPSNRLSAAAQSFQSYLPAPINGNIQNNYLTQLPETVSVNNVTGKVDVNLSDKNRFFAVYSTGRYTTNFTGSLAPGTNSLPLPYTQARFVKEYPTTGQIHDTYLLTPNLVNQFGVSYGRMYIPLVNDTADGNYPQKAGLKGLPPGIASTAMPDISFSGANSPISWVGTNAHANVEAANTLAVQNNMLWTRGKHFITFGFQFQALQDNFNNPLTGTLAGFTFSNNQTAAFSSTGSILSNTGNAYASYLLGAVSSSSVTQNAVAETGGRYKDYSSYIQDDIKASSRLTLNLGLRWDIFGPFKEVANRMSFFNPLLPNPAAGNHLGALEFAGDGADSCHCSTPIRTHYLNFAPRVGLAYRLGDKTVIRSSFALNYIHAGGVGGRVNGRQGLSQLGFNTTASFSSTVTGAQAFNWDDGYPSYQVPPFIDPSYGTGFITSNPNGAQTITYGDPELGAKPPYYVNWSFGFERSLTSSMTLGLAYSGSSGHFLAGAGNAGPETNQIPLQYLALGSLLSATATPTTIAAAQAVFPNIGLPFPNFVGTIAQMLRPFPQYGGISNPWANLGNSTYNSLRATFNRRFSHGLTFMLGYTFSKELDDLAGPRNPFDNSLEKAPGTIDRAHVLSATFVYQLPFGAGHLLGSNRVASAIIGGWQVAGVVTYNSGAPLTISANGCTSGSILGPCFPNYNPSFSGDVRINGNYGSGSVLGSTPTVYLDKTAFVDPAPFTVGNVPRSAAFGLYMQPVKDVDLSLRREFKIREQVKLALQADAFNFGNAVYFTAPGANIDSASFGTLSSQANQPRKVQLSGRITF